MGTARQSCSADTTGLDDYRGSATVAHGEDHPSLLESPRVRTVSVGLIVSAYLVAALIPILGIAAAIHLTFNRERLHSYGVFAVTLISLAAYLDSATSA